MQNIKDKIQQLIVQGDGLLHNIPKKSDYKSTEKNIRDKYRLNEPMASIERELISIGTGELVSSIFGSGKKLGKSVTSKAIKNQYLMQRDNEIRQLHQEHDSRCRECELRYNNWYSESVRTIGLTTSDSSLKKFKDSKLKSRLEARLKWSLQALNQTLSYLERPPQKETLLIKTGEPLKGRKALKEFVQRAKKYVKIQEPYPTPEILEIVEETPANVKSMLLLGPFKNNKDKEMFEKNLALLRKTGKIIDVLSIKCPKTAPFHDRCLISEKKGITTGTSLSGLGMRDSVVNELNEWMDIEKRFDEYMISPKTEHRGIECTGERL